MERKNILIIIFVITTIVASCIAVYFCVNGSNQIKVLEEKINNLTTEIDVSNNEENNVQTYSIINISNNLNDNMYLSKQLGNVKTKIVDGKAYAAFTTNSIGTANYTKELNEYYEILGVNGEVVDISIVEIPTSGYPIFVMLMNDGTLQKTKFVQGSDIVCDGKIEGYENIVRIDAVEVVNTHEFGDSIAKQYSKGIVVTDKEGNTELLKNLY